MKFQNIEGQTFNYLTAIGLTGEKQGKLLLWKFSCKCGKTVITVAWTVKFGHTKSCGCLRDAVLVKRFTKHGHAREGKATPTYKSWYAMTQRCRNPKNKCYKNYGGAGVIVCKRWSSFVHFLADMGERPEGTTLGRFGDKGNYTPSNCAWQTHAEQVQTRRDKRKERA